MFEAVELNRSLSRGEFKAALPPLRAGLIQAQMAAKAARVPILVIVSGLDGTGKGTAVHRLNEWLDPRGIDTHTFWKPSDEELDRPPYWRIWRTLPARGRMAIYYNGWYSDVLLDRVHRRINEAEMEYQLARIATFERMLVEDGALIVKFWCHISRKTQRRRLEKRQHQEIGTISTKPGRHHRLYARFTAAAETMIRRTDTGFAAWNLIEAEDARYRDLSAGRILLEAITHHLSALPRRPRPGKPKAADRVPRPSNTVLSQVSFGRSVSPEEYPARLKKLQARVTDLTWTAHEKEISSVLVFEGWDAAGKGSAIRRVTEAIDARLFRVVPIAAPSEEERDRHYLWRFWRHLPRSGMVTIFDRSWYGRVLVERVEAFANREEWTRAYHEINEFEKQLVEHGTVILKFWIHITPEEQIQRFRKREKVTHKQYKITPEDWRNRSKWAAYEQAVHDMVTHTSSQSAPWIIVPGNDKRYARLLILRELGKALQKAV